MAELPGLEELLLGGYDVSALLAGAPAQGGGQRLGVLGLETQLQLKTPGLPQPSLGWSAVPSAEQNDLYQVRQRREALAGNLRLSSGLVTRGRCLNVTCCT